MVDMAATTVYKFYRHFVWVVAAEQKRLNDDLVVGGPGIEAEADEITFRCFERDDGALVWPHHDIAGPDVGRGRDAGTRKRIRVRCHCTCKPQAVLHTYGQFPL